jgi:hypothetical protein
MDLTFHEKKGALLITTKDYRAVIFKVLPDPHGRIS